MTEDRMAINTHYFRKFFLDSSFLPKNSTLGNMATYCSMDDRKLMVQHGVIDVLRPIMDSGVFDMTER